MNPDCASFMQYNYSNIIEKNEVQSHKQISDGKNISQLQKQYLDFLNFYSEQFFLGLKFKPFSLFTVSLWARKFKKVQAKKSREIK